MAGQSRIIEPAAKNAAEALSHLARAAKVARESARLGRATANIAVEGDHRWQVPALGAHLKGGHLVDQGFQENACSLPMALRSILAADWVEVKETVG